MTEEKVTYDDFMKAVAKLEKIAHTGGVCLPISDWALVELYTSVQGCVEDWDSSFWERLWMWLAYGWDKELIDESRDFLTRMRGPFLAAMRRIKVEGYRLEAPDE